MEKKSLAYSIAKNRLRYDRRKRVTKKKRTSGGLRAMSAIASCTGFPIEGIVEIPTVYCKGDYEVTVDGCTGILVYSDTEIVLRTKRGTCTVCGEGLSMADFIRESLGIRGRIESIRFGR